MEDPDFTIREMIVTVNWPGATARQIEEQVTDKIEKKLQDTPGLDYLKSQSTPGQSKISVVLKDDAVSDSQIRPIWLEVRNKGSKTGTILIRDSYQAMMQAAKQYETTKDVIILGEHRNNKKVESSETTSRKRKTAS